MSDSLRINEVFYSIQGESSHAGRPCIFVRLTGCNLRCSYCDTQEAFYKGVVYSFESLLNLIKNYGCNVVEITGGEPLMQPNVVGFISMLLNNGYEVLMETSGSYDISVLPEAVKVIMDIKTPDSKMHKHNLWNNIAKLKEEDEIKFVLNSGQDYLWSKEIVLDKLAMFKGAIFFSPVISNVSPKDLAQWICQDSLDVRLQLQLHKSIWGDDPEGTKAN